MSRRAAVLVLACGALCGSPTGAETLTSEAFRIECDAGGIRSLRHPKDVFDTDYIAANAALGRLIVRYRAAPHGDWRELSELVPGTPAVDARTIRYRLGRRPPSLAARSTAATVFGSGGLRALSDGSVSAPVFTFSPARGTVQWVQYTFPLEQEVSRVEAFWVTPPPSWRLLFAEGSEWKEVAARTPYGREASTLTAVEFQPLRTLALRLEVTLAGEPASLAEWRVGPDPAPEPPADLAVEGTFGLDDGTLEWTVTLANTSGHPLEVGDLAVPLPFAERVPPRADIYTRKLMRHALVAGHGSWVYWQRSNGVGPFLAMTPSPGTAFEYFDSSTGATAGGFGGTFTPYLHARAARAAAERSGGNWRLPTSGLTLAPGARRTYGFRFRWAPDVAGIRSLLHDEGLFDTAVVPGMVLPVDLPALVSLRTKNRIESVVAEHPGRTRIEDLGEKAAGARVYRVSFSKLGENLLTVGYSGGRWTTLEFFVTEPLETVIKKRASFLVSRHQHTDPSRWYVGAYGDWDQRNEVLRGPEDRDGLSSWLTDANDDAGNARPAFIASKNAFFPDEKEIRSLELYISRYLWGGMQMTEAEKYPYGIYGIPNWKANRESPDEGRSGRAHLWRIYDYPHIALLYFRMYQIATHYPDKVAHLDAATYLERAYRTAVAYWTVPNEIERWSADNVGTMNEAFLAELIEALDEEGRPEWARTLRGYWEGKVERFVNRPPNLYGSEFPFDSTGFESTGAFAAYAVRNAETELRRRVSADAARSFLEFQLRLNLTARGWLETTYYQLGSDYRASMTYLLSYMSQLGGWSILDYALQFAPDPAELLRLGYASSLSSWALVNSGTAESGWGYWYPSATNDGATGGGFMPEAIGRTWIGKTVPRGAWHYSAEADVGYCGALRTHATIVTDDPRFGEIALGGRLERAGRAVEVIPRDGLRARLHVRRSGQRLSLRLEGAGYARERPIRIADDLADLRFTIENRAGRPHRARLVVAGLPPGTYAVTVDGRRVATLRGGARPEREDEVALPIAGESATVAIVREVHGKAAQQWRAAAASRRSAHPLRPGEEAEDLAHHALRLIGVEQELRVRGAFEDDPFLGAGGLLVGRPNPGQPGPGSRRVVAREKEQGRRAQPLRLVGLGGQQDQAVDLGRSVDGCPTGGPASQASADGRHRPGARPSKVASRGEDVQVEGRRPDVLLAGAAGTAVATQVDRHDSEARVRQHPRLLLPTPLVEPAAVDEHDAAVAPAVDVRLDDPAILGGDRDARGRRGFACHEPGGDQVLHQSHVSTSSGRARQPRFSPGALPAAGAFPVRARS